MCLSPTHRPTNLPYLPDTTTSNTGSNISGTSSGLSSSSSSASPASGSGAQASAATTPGPARYRDKNGRGESALHVAAIKGDYDQVKKLLDQGVNPNVTDNAGV